MPNSDRPGDASNVQGRRAPRTFLAAALFALVSVPSALDAQPVRGGPRVRVRLASHTYNGALVGVKDDTLVIDVNGDARAASNLRYLALREVQSVDVSVGQHRHVLRGAIIGALSGAGFGAFAGSQGGCGETSGGFGERSSGCSGRGLVAYHAIMFGTFGLLLGTYIGAALVRENWRGIEPTRLPKVALGGDSQSGFVKVQFAVGAR